MIFDIFFSICQTEVDGYTPSEKKMFLNFFDQLKLADQLGFGTAWVAETHLSCQIQKQNPGAVIPEFKGEIGLNTDILQLAHKAFAITKNINIGSAIRNILCNGGPLAHAEAIKTFLSFHGLDPSEKRTLNIGFAAGRFNFSNIPYGIVPRNDLEKSAWPVIRGKVFIEATEIFLKALRGDIFSSKEITPKTISRIDFRSDSDWEKVIKVFGTPVDNIEIPSFWVFDKVGVIPFDAPLEYLNLTIGSHDPKAQIHANKYMPCGVFNLSIIPASEIEETHKRMNEHFNPSGGEWNRSFMPRTVLVFMSNDKNFSQQKNREIANQRAENAMSNYWKAMEGTLDPQKIAKAVENALTGTAEDIKQQLKDRFHPDDRIMLWFDFNNHNNDEVKQNMIDFRELVIS